MQKSTTKMYRQGDVMLALCESDMPKKCKPVELELGRVILAHGEVTGHHHSFGSSSGVALLEAPSGDRYLKVKKQASLEHQEHGTIEVPAGTYRVIRQREYSPEAIRNVMD